MRTIVLAALHIALSACASSQPALSGRPITSCLSALQEGVVGTFTGEISSGGIHGIFLRTTDCPAEFVSLEEGNLSTDPEYAELVRRIYREGNIGTLNKHIAVRIRGRVDRADGRVSLTIIDVEYVSTR